MTEPVPPRPVVVSGPVSPVDLDLAAIEANIALREDAPVSSDRYADATIRVLVAVPALVAEVKRLREDNERLAGERADANDRAEEAASIVPRPEELDGWWTAYGVKIQSVGEDGDWLALGHVEPLRMLAAIRKAARDEIGLDTFEVFGEFHPAVEELTGGIEHGRAYFTTSDVDDWAWFANWSTDAQTHRAAVDVTLWRS